LKAPPGERDSLYSHLTTRLLTLLGESPVSALLSAVTAVELLAKPFGLGNRLSF